MSENRRGANEDIASDCDYAGRIFTSGPYAPRFVEKVALFLGTLQPASILDLGCGTGSILIALARRYPSAQCCGVDISQVNIDAARAAAATAAIEDRTKLVAADYMSTPLQGFDLIVSYSTLHLIAGAGDALIAKLALDVKPDGIVVLTMPVNDPYNRWLFRLRRLFRAARSALTDRLILQAGMILTRGSRSRQDILDRVAYMYVLPRLLWGPELSARFALQGLATIVEEAEPHASVAQPKHALIVLRRTA